MLGKRFLGFFGKCCRSMADLGSVSDDYLQYMLLQFPTNVTGWICHTLVTSSLLKAIGVGSFTGTTAAASAAAIRWVSKDGIGALGRLFVGGRFGNLFDDDPKQWRMYADFIGSAGSIFDLVTQVYPAYFLPLASLGNLAKAVARGLKDPSFRVIQNHFAISGNLGEVAAKEEVWEVGAQLFGLALGILMLVKTLLKLYTKEKYLLMVNQQKRDFEVFVSFKVGATSISVLRSVWQTYWLHENWESSVNVFDQLAQSLREMENRASDYPMEYDGACLQMRLSYSPAAQFFLFLVQWTDCHLAGALGLLRILIYKAYEDGKTTMSIQERKASIREFYGEYRVHSRQLL
ncbi:hypothetical protein GH714_017222 [Hevea brasiliensis]|uniref:Protein root UVB sensitive/RUS domain-containing protein n=1 Tax=Hevea brasiliensis TaxID=3981 RepID=A0A6A6M0Q8_HEVBR|nr:hypothetical protein GH714_017222 [Hevea brasiliensis]